MGFAQLDNCKKCKKMFENLKITANTALFVSVRLRELFFRLEIY